MTDFDAIVIGAGNAGLTAATKLQRGGQKTLLLERHNIPGGCATSFVRGDYEFEVALHQLSGMGSEESPGPLRNIFNDLGVVEKLEFIEESELYRVVVPGDIDVTLPASVDGIAAAIKKLSPGSDNAIDAFLSLCGTMAMERFLLLPEIEKTGDKEELKKTCPNLVKYGLKSTKEVLDEFFDDEKVKTALGAYWGYLGMPLDELIFADMGMMVYAYAEFKPYHIKGGSQALSNALLESFLEAGGEVRFNTAAQKILTENGAVSAVRIETREEITCKNVVSNSSALHTYNEMLDVGDQCTEIKEDFKKRRVGISGFVLYMGLDCPPEELSLTAATTFISTTRDDRAAYERAKTLDEPLGCAFTCYNLEDPDFAPKGKSIASLMCMQYGAAWEELSPEEYQRTKYEFSEKLLNIAETTIPNLRQHIEEVEAASPLTMMRYLNTPGGAFYGFDQNKVDSEFFRKELPSVEGLHLSGAWAGMAGFQPTYQGGAATARKIIKASKLSDQKEAAHVA